MRILHAISSLAPSNGGPPIGAVAMARAAAALGHEVVIHATDHGMSEELVRSIGKTGGDGVRIVVHRCLRPGSLTRHASFGLWRALADEIPKSDVVHLHSLYMFHDWVVWRECRRAGVPYILQPHGTFDPLLNRRHRWRKAIAEVLFQDRVTRDATLIQFTSEMERDQAQRYTFGRPGVVVPVGVDLDRFGALPPPDRFRTHYPEIGDRRIILFLSRLNYKKGLDILVPAFAGAVARRPDLHLVLVGPDGGYEAQARALAAEHAVADRVTFTGYVSAERALEALSAADIYALPSQAENFGLAAAEALAASVPCLLSEQVQIVPAAARAGACRTAPLTIPAWTEAILALLSDPDAAQRLRRRAREYACATFAWPVIGAQLIKTYEQAVTIARSRQVQSGGLLRRAWGE